MVMMMMMMMMMTRGLMMKLLRVIVFRSWMTSLGHCALMETAASRRMMVVTMMMVISVSGLLNVVVLMRVHWRYHMLLLLLLLLLLIWIWRGRGVIQVGVAQTVLRGDYRRGGTILVENGTRRRVKALRRRAGRRA